MLLVGTTTTATLQFNSPRCDQLSSSQLSFVVEWWAIDPYLNNSTSSSSEHPNKSPPPTEGLVYVYIVIINPVLLVVSSSFLSNFFYELNQTFKFTEDICHMCKCYAITGSVFGFLLAIEIISGILSRQFNHDHQASKVSNFHIYSSLILFAIMHGVSRILT